MLIESLFLFFLFLLGRFFVITYNELKRIFLHEMKNENKKIFLMLIFDVYVYLYMIIPTTALSLNFISKFFLCFLESTLKKYF